MTAERLAVALLWLLIVLPAGVGAAVLLVEAYRGRQ